MPDRPEPPVYLDHAASSPVVPAAAAVVSEWLTHGYGNPSGSHSIARRARTVVEDSREIVAEFMGVAPGEVVFTSGGTEADNLGVLGPLAHRRGAVVVSGVEHPAVLEAAAAAGRVLGREVRVAPVDGQGGIDLAGLRQVLASSTAVVSIQTANHETGVVQPIPDLVARIRKWAPDAVIHTDAVAAAPWLDLPASTAGADLVSISGHKLGGPQGIGALGLRHDVVVAALLHGGGQERERRSGTHNVAAIAGLAAAIRDLAGRRAETAAVARRRDLLAALIRHSVDGAIETAPDARRLPGHCHFRFPGLENEELLFLLDRSGVCASAGAACASGAIEASPVLVAMGVTKDEAGSALRLTLGWQTTEDEVRRAAAVLADAVTRLRGPR